MSRRLDTGFMLDRQWHVMRGEMERTKRPALLLLVRTLTEAGIDYAIIGGVAVQVHLAEPRTTLDIDVALTNRDDIPRRRLEDLGFRPVGRFPHSENWAAPDGTPVQFTDDPALAPALHRTEDVDLGEVRARVIGRADLLHEKLRAAADPARRRSKRLQDLADAQSLVEETPALTAELSPSERAVLDRLPG
jgi:hypothetical protein